MFQLILTNPPPCKKYDTVLMEVCVIGQSHYINVQVYRCIQTYKQGKKIMWRQNAVCVGYHYTSNQIACVMFLPTYAGNNPCSKVICEHGEECHVDRRGEAKCTCPLRCEKVLRPVCANNSRTYDNECELRRQSCLSRIRVNILYVGMCGACFILLVN